MDFQIDSPISPMNFQNIVQALDLKETDAVLDIGCGKGELLFSIQKTYNCICVGLDKSADQIEKARIRCGSNERIELSVSDIDTFPRERKYDMVSCFGTWYGFPGLSLMEEFAKPGALYLYGLNYWRKDPHGRYESRFGIDVTEQGFKTLELQIKHFYDLGFEVLYMYTNTKQEYDYYQSSFWRNRSYDTADDNRQSKIDYVNWIREYHGWSAWLLRKYVGGGC